MKTAEQVQEKIKGYQDQIDKIQEIKKLDEYISVNSYNTVMSEIEIVVKKLEQKIEELNWFLEDAK